MERNEEIEMQLWEFIDGTCTEADNKRISGLILNDAAWKQAYGEILAFDTAINTSLELEQPSMRFSKNVMEAISHVSIAPPTKKYINTNIIRSIAALFIIAIGAALGYAIIMALHSPASATDMSFASRPLPKFQFSKLFDNNMLNIVVVVNIILGLLLIDTLLRRKRTNYSS